MVGFLTGNPIPAWITGLRDDLSNDAFLTALETDLPANFLATPFGAALRPTIDAMYRRPGAAPVPVQPAPQAAEIANAALAPALLQAVAAQAGGAGPADAGAATVAGPIHICTNPASFRNTLNTHRAVVAFFTSARCAPCHAIQPEFERLANEHTRGDEFEGGGRIAFVKVDIGAGMGGMLAQEYNVSATPTFIFYRDGNKVSGTIYGFCWLQAQSLRSDTLSAGCKRTRAGESSQYAPLGDLSTYAADYIYHYRLG